MAGENRTDRIWSDWAIPPGDFLAETLDALGMSQAELAARSNRPTQAISEIAGGRKAITADTALEFERVLGVPAHIWTGLESDYQLTLARLRARKNLETEIPLSKAFPVLELERKGWIAKSPRGDEAARVGALQNFFGVATLSAVTEHAIVDNVSLRVSDRAKPDPGALAAWLRKGLIDAQDCETDEFDSMRWEVALEQIRHLTTEPPEVFLKPMTKLCANAGVALVLTPELKGTAANGCTRWIGRSKAMIQLNLRYRWGDIFWFTFFHEARHVLQRKIKYVFVDLRDRDEDRDEADADCFAADTLIPPRVWADFAQAGAFSETDVVEFARRAGVHPGIVVGRAQREVWKRYDLLNRLRTRYVWDGT